MSSLGLCSHRHLTEGKVVTEDFVCSFSSLEAVYFDFNSWALVLVCSVLIITVDIRGNLRSYIITRILYSLLYF